MTNAASSPTVVPETLRDIKPPIEIPNIWVWIAVGTVVLLLVATAVGLILYFSLRRKQIAVPPPIPPHVRAKQKLQEALALISQPKPFCILVSDTARFYLEERFNFRAPERTTEEFLHELQNTNLLLPDQKESLGEFLKRCDLVKFARYEPREVELKDMLNSAIRLVEETEPVETKAESENRESGNDPSEEVVNHKSQIVNPK
jgi:hypothetical protein